MDESSQTQNRRARRSNVLMAAALELSGKSIPVKLRNLSAEGALVEGDGLPVEGSEIVFRRQDLSVAGRVVWVSSGRAGLSFNEPLAPETVLRHVPTPRARVQPSFRRPGFTTHSPLSPEERRMAEQWGRRPAFDLAGE